MTAHDIAEAKCNGSSHVVAADLPLCMDLDGTLVRTDTLWEALIDILRRNPLQLFVLLSCLWRGKAFFKQRAAELAKIDVSTLPYRPELVAFLRLERGRSRRIVLATGSDQVLADQVGDYLGVFDQVIGSNGVVNLTGRQKRDELVKRFGEKGFVYVGDSNRDIPVWRQAAEGIAVGRDASWTKRLRAKGIRVSTSLPAVNLDPHAVMQILRPHHWLKNVLVFVPIVLADQVLNWQAWLLAALAAAAISLAASGMYVWNDILDLESDRRHPVKRSRPLASGTLPISVALALVPLLLGAGMLLASLLPPGCVLLIASYAGLSLVYSLHLKKIAILDVIFLAGLYCFRIFLGGAATGIPISKWTMLFGVFLFTSLAFLKRFTELQLKADEANGNGRRGYLGDDLATVGSFGIMSGYIAALVFSLYLNSPEAVVQYSHPMYLWFVCPALLYWISHVWLLAQRGQMHTDPIVFAARDKVSYGVFAVIAGILWLAAR
ncbi:MAG TPA: UbiA family prenyltransferase [Bryobacteraceae bacterium]|nr:UbiA family prenyltransferase [Bryobacteraceae bacterium]